MLKFDASYYLNKYPDVAAAVAAGQTTAEAHFNNFGQLEGRIPNAYFNPVEYVQLYADLASQGKGFNAWAHYVTFGANEGRIPSAQFANFDATKYLASNSDLTAAGLKTDAQALDHYLTYGVKEGRVAYNKDGSVLTLTNVNSSTSLTAELTVNTDVATANVFNAGLAYTPGGNDRVNALQDEDILTGIGTNPTLNATLGNANDNGAIIITPKLVNVQTVNVDFTGSGGAVQALDLQDTTGLKTVNINRVTQASNTARIENIKQVIDTMSIARTNANEAGVVEFSFGTGTLAGSNTASLKLSDVQVGTVNIGGNSSTVTAAGVSTTGYENLTVNSGSVANSIGTLNLPMDTGVTGKVTITGDKDLTLASKSSVINGATTTVESTNYAGGIAQASGRLASIDASAFTGNLTLNIGNGIYTTGQADTSGTTQNVTITGGKGNDKFILQDTIEAGDSLTGGDGTDTLLIVNGGNVNSSSSSVTKIEQVEVRLNTTSTATVDFDKLPDLNTGTGVTSVTVRNESNTNVAAPANSAPTAGTTTFNLNNLSAGQGVAVKIEHSDTSSNGLTQSVINANLKSASGASDTVGITIAEGLNNDARFNFTLAAGSASAQVENVTLTDTDSESNTVLLSNVAQHTGTITIDKPTTITKSVGQFINLDVAAAATNASLVGGYGIEVNGSPLTAGAAKDFQTTITTGDSAVNASTVTSSTIYRTLNNGAAGETRIIAQTFNASTETADVIARFGDVTRSDGVSSMSVKTGSGNDTLIFDAQDVKNAGYTSGDTVAAGTGLDTLVIDGNNNGTVAGRIDVQKSEWDNTTGVDVLRLAGNQGVANATDVKDSGGFVKATAGGYYVEIDNEFVKQTDAGNNLVIVNNDGNLATNLESDLVLNVRALAQTSNVNFIGANSNGADATLISANRIQVEDNSANANNKFDGGDSNINNTTTAGSVVIGNNNVFEVFNTSDVSINDLSNTKNFNRIEATNDVSVVQTMKLVLNDTVMDQLVDSNHTAANTTLAAQSQIERLQVVANDNAIVNGAYQQVSVDASVVTNKFALDILTGRGTDTVIGTAGNDNIVMLGNYTTGTYTDPYNDTITGTKFDIDVKANLAAGAVVTQLVATDSINGGAGTDKLITYGAIDLTGATLTSIELIEAHSDVRLTAAQYNQLIANRVALNANDTSAVISFVGTGTHALTVVNNDGTTTNVDLGRVNLTSGSGNLVVNTAAGTATGAVAPTTSGTATDATTVGSITVNGTEVSTVPGTTSGTTPTTPTNPTTGTTVAVAAANTTAYDASAANVTFNVASGNYTYNINGFGSGDKLAFATGQALSITNNSGTDGVIDITGTMNGQLVTIHLTGVAAAQDGAVFSVDSFNTAFGSGSLA